MEGWVEWGGGQKEERSNHAKTSIRVFCPFVSVSRWCQHTERSLCGCGRGRGRAQGSDQGLGSCAGGAAWLQQCSTFTWSTQTCYKIALSLVASQRSWTVLPTAALSSSSRGTALSGSSPQWLINLSAIPVKALRLHQLIRHWPKINPPSANRAF